MLGRFGCLAGCVGIVLGLSACGEDRPAAGDSDSEEGGSGGAITVGGGGAGASTGTGGASTSCGDGVVDAGEECDTAGPSATCDADCTTPACGDGERNAAAGEGCDDGNTADGDFCSAACLPTEVVLEGPFQSNTSPGGTISVAATQGRFVAAWAKDEIGSVSGPLQYASWQADGTPVVAKQTLDASAPAAGPMAVDAAGRVLMLYWTGAAYSTQYRYASPGGDLGGAAQTLLPGYLAGQLGAPGSGGFCVLGFDGQIRCTGAADAFGAPTTLVPVGSNSYPIASAELLPTAQGLAAAYIVQGDGAQDPDELRLRLLDGAGAPAAAELLVSPVQNTFLLGGVARPDGGFAFAAANYDEVAFLPFSADGQLDAANVTTLATGVIGSRIVGHSSGRFVLVYREITAELDPNLGTVIETCSIQARVFSDSGQPLAAPLPVYEPPHGVCAWPASVALNDAGDLFAGWAQFVDGASATSTCQVSAKILPGVVPP